MNPAPNSKESKSRRPSAKGLATALLFVGILGVLGYSALSSNENVAVKATCENIAEGYSCTLTGDNKKPATLDVCWSINRVCENGVKSSLHQCRTIYFEPGQPSKTMFENSAFENNQKCDKVSSYVIGDINIGNARTLPSATAKP